MRMLLTALLLFLIVGCASVQGVEEKPCEDNTELIQDALLDLELIENDIEYYSEIMSLPKEERPKLRCGSCFEEDLKNAEIKKQFLLERIEVLRKTNC